MRRQCQGSGPPEGNDTPIQFRMFHRKKNAGDYRDTGKNEKGLGQPITEQKKRA